VIDTIIKQDVNDCFGGTNGSISIQVSGGTPPYEYSIDGGSSYQATGDYFGLDNGNYPIRVRDNNGCNIYGGIIRINQPDFFTVASQSSVNVQGCHGDLTGQIHFDVTGGTPHSTNGYQYSVDGGTNFYYNDGDFTGLGAGNFIPVAQDENGCLAYGQPIVITEPDTLILNIVSQQNVLCYSGSTGYINLMAEGGEYPFTFSINGGLNYSTGTFFPGLTAGTYQTYVKDDYNCISEGPTVVITQPDSLTISDVVVTNIEGCYGDDDGVISITVTNGVAPYSYSIDNGNSYYDDNGGTFTNLTPGNYYIRVIDSNYCTGFSDLNHDTFIDTFVITQPPQLQIIDYEKHDITCFGETDGTLQIFAAGGTGDIHYSIDNGLTYPVTTGLFEHLSQGTYLMRISDDNGCSSSAVSVSIYEPELFEITDILVEDETCPGLNDGSIRFYINGGTFPYRFSSDNGLTFQSYNIISNLAPGTYYPAAIDTNTCMAFWPEITIDSAVYAGLFTTDVTEGCSPLDVQFTRISEGVTYLWDFDDETTSNQNEPLHTFINTTLNPVTFTVTAYSVSPNNCLDTTYTDITVYPLPQLHFSANPDTAYYPDATIEIINNSPEGYTDYYWDFGDGSTSFAEEPLSHTYGDCGEYMIKMSADNLWCTDSVEKNILVTTFQPEAFFETDTTQSCWPVTINFSNQSHFITDFEWNLGDGTMSNENIFSHTYDTPGSYTVTLNTDGWCGTQDTYDTIITVFESPVVDFDVSPDTVMLPSQPIHCVNLSSDDSELYFWAFGDGGTSTDEDPVWQYLQPGTFYISLTVTSVNKCVDSLTLAANVVVLPEGKILLPNAFTPNNDGFSDVFMPAVYNSVKSFSFEIFNRWGEKVFYSNDINVGWNGYFNGSLAPQDVYIWRINGLYLNGTPFENAGSITLIR
jgi:gliding motility-associated-like protein